MGGKVLFLGLKNGGNHVLFFKLGLERGGVAPPTPPGSPLPRFARARPRPLEPPGLLALLEAKTLSRPSNLVFGRAGANRKSWLEKSPPRPSLFTARLGRAKPGLAGGGPSPSWLRGSSAGRACAWPRIPGGCKHGSQRYTTHCCLPCRRPHAHALLRVKTPAALEIKVFFPPSHRLPRTAERARGRQRVNPRALAPPPPRPPARLPHRSPRAVPFPAPGPGNPRPGPLRWPPLRASHRGKKAPEGALLTAAGVRFLSSRWILLFMSMFPSSPLFNLTFRGGGRGGRGVPACTARAVGRGLLAAEAGDAVAGGGQRTRRRAEPPEPSYSRERRETMEGKGGWSAAPVSLPPPPVAAPHCA